jgi:hypothetical protein
MMARRNGSLGRHGRRRKAFKIPQSRVPQRFAVCIQTVFELLFRLLLHFKILLFRLASSGQHPDSLPSSSCIFALLDVLC